MHELILHTYIYVTIQKWKQNKLSKWNIIRFVTPIRKQWNKKINQRNVQNDGNEKQNKIHIWKVDIIWFCITWLEQIQHSSLLRYSTKKS